MAGVMLDCAVCGARKWKPVEEAHAEDLRISGAAKLFCENCARETYWLYSQHSEGAMAPRRAGEQAARASAGSAAGASSASSTAEQATPMRSMQTERRVGIDRRARSRRTQRRVALQVPVRLRVISAASQFEEITRTMNVSRSGIYIQSERPYTKGLPIYVAMNYSAREPGMSGEQKATVVRVDSLPGSPGRGVAIQLH
jgi:PilZ domain